MVPGWRRYRQRRRAGRESVQGDPVTTGHARLRGTWENRRRRRHTQWTMAGGAILLTRLADHTLTDAANNQGQPGALVCLGGMDGGAEDVSRLRGSGPHQGRHEHGQKGRKHAGPPRCHVQSSMPGTEVTGAFYGPRRQGQGVRRGPWFPRWPPLARLQRSSGPRSRN